LYCTQCLIVLLVIVLRRIMISIRSYHVLMRRPDSKRSSVTFIQISVCHWNRTGRENCSFVCEPQRQVHFCIQPEGGRRWLTPSLMSGCAHSSMDGLKRRAGKRSKTTADVLSSITTQNRSVLAVSLKRLQNNAAYLVHAAPQTTVFGIAVLPELLKVFSQKPPLPCCNYCTPSAVRCCSALALGPAAAAAAIPTWLLPPPHGPSAPAAGGR